MRCRYSIASLVLGLLFCSGAAHAQHALPLPATVPLRFERWQAAPPLENSKPIENFVPGNGSRTRHALIGGAVGAVAGFVLCTTISTLADDSAGGGVSFCPLDTTLLIMGGGFALGAAIGWAI